MVRSTYCSASVDNRDAYLYNAVAWYIALLGDPETTHLTILQNGAGVGGAHVLKVAASASRGVLQDHDIEYECKESEGAYATDGKPEVWRRIVLTSSSSSNDDENAPLKFVEEALQAYKKHRETIKATRTVEFSGGHVKTYAWNDCDNSGWAVDGEFARRPLSTLFLPGKGAQNLLENLRDFLAEETQAKYASLHVPMIKAVLLHGVPGSGKTTLVRCLASELGMNLACFDGEDMDELYTAATHLPQGCILSIDDLDCIITGGGRQRSGFSKILGMLDGVARRDPLIVFMTTNMPQELDISLRRRVDHCIGFGYARALEGRQLIQHFYPALGDESAKNVFQKLTKNGVRRITMCMLTKFLVQSMKHGDPWKLLERDPGAFDALYSAHKNESIAAHVYT
jgi:hypothetical protein